LQELAKRTGGHYYRASSLDDLRQAYARVLVSAFSQNILANKLADTDRGRQIENSKRIRTVPHASGQAQAAVKQARAILATINVDQWRNLDGIVHASHLIDAVKNIRIDESTPVRDRGNALAPCEGISERVVEILRRGWLDAAQSLIDPVPDYYEVGGMVLDEVLGYKPPGVFTPIGGYVGTLQTTLGLVQSIGAACELATRCIEAIAIKP
jgi:hypothetical protein